MLPSLSTRVHEDKATRINFFQSHEKKLFKKRRNNRDLRKENVQLELVLPLVLAQIISLFPICGISQENVSNLRFKWKSYKVFYCFVLISFEIFFIGLTLNECLHSKISLSRFGDILFYGGSTCVSFLFLRLAMGWKDLMLQWTSVQDYMSGLKEYSVRNKIIIMTLWLAFSSVSEHLLSIIESIITYTDIEGKQLNTYLAHRHELMFYVVPYSLAVGLLAHVIKFLITMIWNFTDIFLTAISLSLGKMFKQFSLDLESTSKSVTPETSLNYWRKRREIYSRLSLLTKLVDEKFSMMVLFSFGINLYYICVQLLHTITPIESVFHMVYFVGSFGHLLCRTCAVCFAASSVYENSKQPLSVIFSVPSEQFNTEVQRLHMQISSETLALTGCRFFTVTRTLILTIAGTIVTYEIVLFQFSRNQTESANITCTVI